MELYIKRRLKVQCTEQCPEIAVDISVTQFFTMLLIIFLKPHALFKEKEHGVCYPDGGPTSLSYKASAAS